MGRGGLADFCFGETFPLSITIIALVGGERMDDSRADVLLHPVRLRIMQAVEANGQLTVRQLGRILKDVPQASLYRHLNKLVEADFLHVVAERPVGGAIERVYAVVEGAGVLPSEEFAHATKADHMRYFAAFCAMLMSKFDQYLSRDRFDLAADGVGYRVHSLYLSDEELHQLIDAMRGPVEAATKNKPAPGRRRRLLATVLMPEQDVINQTGGHEEESS